MTKPKLGFTGLGAMGLPVARHLMDFGYSVDIWARTPTKVAELSSAGATLCSTPATLATGSDIVFLCVFDAAAVDNVVFGAIGVAIGGFTEKLLIDHSTTHPERSREMAAWLKSETGMGRVDAPVSGGAKGTKAGSLIVMAGGKDAYIARAQTITSAYAKRFAHIDPIGAGQASKVCTQMIIGSTIAVWDEALNFAKEFGVKATGPPDCLAIDWADSAVAQDHAKRIARMAPDSVGAGLMQKDMGSAPDMAGITGSPMPITGQVAELYRLVAPQTGESGQASLIPIYTDSPFIED